MKKLFTHIDAYAISTGEKKDFHDFCLETKAQSIELLDIYIPYPDDHLIKQAKPKKGLDMVAIAAGITGLITISFLIMLLNRQLAIQYGNLNNIPMLAYIPVMFVFIILFAALGVFFYFMISGRLLPGQQNPLYGSSDEFVALIKKEELLKIDVPKKFKIKEVDFVKQNYTLPIPFKLSRADE